jgi:hypothetical protein
MILSLLVLRADFWDLRWLDCLPVVLERLGLQYSWMALLYALGHEDRLRADGLIPDTESAESVRDLFAKLVRQPGADELPLHPELGLQAAVTLRSSVLGCELRVEAANDIASIQLGEAILAAFEALLATSLNNNVFPYRSGFRFKIRPSDFLSGLPEYSVVAEDLIEIRHRRGPVDRTVEERSKFRDWLIELIAQTLPSIVVIQNASAYLEQLARDEVGFGRALNFADAWVSVRNILGDKVRFRVSDWEIEEGVEKFPPKRSMPWHDGIEELSDAPKRTEAPKLGIGKAPEELMSTDDLRHHDRRVFSLIDIPLWNRAKWTGTIYGNAPNQTPSLALGFRDKMAARAIFEGLRAKVGKVDSDELLRVSIITGVDKRNPAHYAVVVGGNLEQEARRVGDLTQFVTVSRINLMQPSATTNLDAFLREFSRAGTYALLPAYFESLSQRPELFPDLVILKRQLRVCPAWEVGPNDPDMSALQEDCDPIIPSGVKDPPVLKALEAIRKFRQGRTTTAQKATPTTAAKTGRNQPCPCGSGRKFKKCHGR